MSGTGQCYDWTIWDLNQGIAKVVSVVTFVHELMGSNAFKQRLVFLTSGEQL